MGFKNVIAQGGGGGGNGAPTFIYNEQIRRSSGISIPKLAISESERRTDAIRVNPTLTDTERRTDAYRIPTAQFAMSEPERRADAPQIPLLRVSDQAQRTDKTTVSVLYQTPGTRNFIVPNGVSTMVMEAWGAGGAGGTATVNSGGGGKGGAYARRNAQAVTAGQTLTVTVAPSVAAAAGAASTVATGGAGQFAVASQNFSSTETSSDSAAVQAGASFFIQGASVSFFAKTDVAGAGTQINIPASIQNQDIILLVRFVDPNEDPTPNSFIELYRYDFAQGSFSVLYKIGSTADSGGAVVYTTSSATTNSASICVYRGGASISLEYAAPVQSGNQKPINLQGFTKQTQGFAVFTPATRSFSGVVSWSPPASVTERSDVSGTSATGSNKSFSVNDAPLTAQAGTTLLSAAGGNVGGNGSATAGGTGATGQNGTSTGDVTFTGGNGANGTLTAGGAGGGGAGSNGNATGATGAGQLGGNGGASAAAGSIYGGGGGGATTLAARGAGAQGAVRLTFTI